MSSVGGRPAALVTGAARGIGRCVALELARHGYDLVVNYSHSVEAARRVAADVEALGGRAVLAQADVSDEARVKAMVEDIRRELGRLDAVVNNAGVTTPTPPSELDALSMSEWDRIFAVNVRGTFQVTRACAPLLRESPAAAVVNLCSIAGVRPTQQPFPYAASKAAIANLTRTLAGALGPKIRVNAVAPGWIRGEWMEKALGEDYERLMERRARATPLRRVVTEEEVAITIVNLITSNPFVNGEVIVIDGGFSATT